MKTLLLSPMFAAVLIGCANPQKQPIIAETVPILPTEVSGSAIPSESQEAVRYQEDLKEYSYGRYADPTHPKTMYEAGKLYRVEQDAAWNLHPSPSIDLPNGPKDAFKDPSAQENVLLAEFEQELQKQRQYTSVIMEQNDALMKQREQDSKKMEEIQSLAEQNKRLAQRLDRMQKEVEEQRKKASQKKTVSESKTPVKIWWKLWKW